MKHPELFGALNTSTVNVRGVLDIIKLEVPSTYLFQQTSFGRRNTPSMEDMSLILLFSPRAAAELLSREQIENFVGAVNLARSKWGTIDVIERRQIQLCTAVISCPVAS